jgi:NAD(P)H-dependent flavin oxidoreductase YrpB (nitropropane dioxygenase family)
LTPVDLHHRDMHLERPRSVNTLLTHDYGVRLPFVGVCAGAAASPSLVAALSRRGGIGILGVECGATTDTQTLVQRLKQATPRLFGIELPVHDSTGERLAIEAHVDVCVEERVGLVVFRSKVPPKPWIDKLHAAGARVWMRTTSAEHAVAAVAIGVDAIVAQDLAERPNAPHLHRLLRQVVKAVRPVMVLAAGGIATGRDVVQALSAGADGVWLDTLDAWNAAHAGPAPAKRRPLGRFARWRSR